MTTKHTTVEEIADDFRKQFDELGLKPPKNSMKNIERELIIDYWMKILKAQEQRVRGEMLKKIYHSKLFQILQYGFRRGSGHTYAQVKGVENVSNAVFIVANENQKKSIGLPKERQISISSANERFFAGRRHPVVIDHHALAVMFEEIIKSLQDNK